MVYTTVPIRVRIGYWFPFPPDLELPCLLSARYPQIEKRQNVLHRPCPPVQNLGQRSVRWRRQHLGRMSKHEHTDAGTSGEDRKKKNTKKGQTHKNGHSLIGWPNEENSTSLIGKKNTKTDR